MCASKRSQPAAAPTVGVQGAEIAFSSLSLRERVGGEGGFIGRCSEVKGKVKSYPLTPALSPRGARGEREQTASLSRASGRP
ncbi:hypothetical protein EMIT0232MI5_50222 [Pseudomonas sp. IT-232MI5]